MRKPSKMPTKSSKTNIKKKAMLQALEKSLGIVTTAAKQVGIDRWTHYDWMKADPEYKAAVDAIEDVALDFAESKLHAQIAKGDTTATIFYLNNKGKKRGYNRPDSNEKKHQQWPTSISFQVHPTKAKDGE